LRGLVGVWNAAYEPRQPRKLTIFWLFLGALIIIGLLVGVTVSKLAGIVLALTGAVGYVVLGILIFAFIPRSDSS
jgi:predicted membrane channel-forming protein YqfA (hemolysin III family)